MPKEEILVRPNWYLCDDFTWLNFEAPELQHIRGYTIDIENVLTDGMDSGDATVREPALGTIEEMQKRGLKIALLTNCTDVKFVEEVRAQVNEVIGRHDTQPVLEPYKPSKTKLHPEPFYFAARQLEVKRSHMAHVDDQYKSQIGATRAGYGLRIWTKPWGKYQHSGVQAFRPIEMGIIRPLVRVLPSTSMHR